VVDQLGYPILLTWAGCVRVAGREGRPLDDERRVWPSDAEGNVIPGAAV
jgi:hypothetical protein